MTNFYLVLFVVYLVAGLFVAMSLIKTGPWKLLIFSVGFIVYGILPVLSIVMDGKALNDPTMEVVGRTLLVVFSVVGGALFSTAWKELRESKRSQVASNG